MNYSEKKKSVVLIILAAGFLVLAFIIGMIMFSSLKEDNYSDVPDGDNFAILTIAGTIQQSPESPLDNVSYNHDI